METQENTWAVVLAAGEGRRLSAAVRQWFGHNRPKQFCAFGDSKPMVEQAVERASTVAPLERILTIIGHDQIQFIPKGAQLGRLIKQPENRGTAAGILFPVAHIRSLDPSATVVILPSDHFISPLRVFSNLLRLAIDETNRRPERVILLAAKAQSPETDYGWIEATAFSNSAGISPVLNFREKPRIEEAVSLFARGGLWNTLIMVAKVSALWSLARRTLPQWTRHFDEFSLRIGSIEEESSIETLYQNLETADFSKEILEPSVESVDVLPLSGVTWSDWGRPERITYTLTQLGLHAPGEKNNGPHRQFIGRSQRVARFS